MSSGFGVLDQVTRDVWDKRSASPEVEQQSQLSINAYQQSAMPISKVHTWLSCGISRPFFLFSHFQEVVGGLRILFR